MPKNDIIGIAAKTPTIKAMSPRITTKIERRIQKIISLYVLL